MRRVFVVGCPRSGTTLLHAALAGHPAVMTLPETHFFRKMWGRLWAYRRFGAVSPRAAACILSQVCEVLDRQSRPRVVIPTGRGYARAFCTVLDRAATESGRDMWVEKSPIHLWCQDQIDRWVPDARYIHIIRDGIDVAASLVEVAARQPKVWLPQLIPGWRRSSHSIPDRDEMLQRVAERWNHDIGVSLGRRGSSTDTIITYKDLVANPADTLAHVSAFLNEPFHEGMLASHESAEVVLGWRGTYEHMGRVRQPMSAHGSGKADWVLSADNRDQLRSLLRDGGRVDKFSLLHHGGT